MLRDSGEAVPWLECCAAESRAVTLKAGPAVSSLWSTDRKEAWVTAAAKTGGREEEMCTCTHTQKVSEQGHTTGERKHAWLKQKIQARWKTNQWKVFISSTTARADSCKFHCSTSKFTQDSEECTIYDKRALRLERAEPSQPWLTVNQSKHRFGLERYWNFVAGNISAAVSTKATVSIQKK